jgi:hypothetical protein
VAQTKHVWWLSRNGGKLMIDYPNFEKGQKVRDLYGDVFTVLYQNGCMVFVEELSNSWFHPTKIHVIGATSESRQAASAPHMD